MNLVADYDSSSSDNDQQKEMKTNDAQIINVKPKVNGFPEVEHQNEKQENNEKEMSPTKIKLPSAKSVMKRKISSESSVLATEYKREQDDKNKVLEQHVKMVTNSKSINGKVNGKKVCWMYRRGRCRLGKKCKMYHDSELRKTEAGEIPATKNKEIELKHTPQKRPYEEVPDDVEDETESRNKIHKKRFGISDDIVPPKKVIEHIERVAKKCH